MIFKNTIEALPELVNFPAKVLGHVVSTVTHLGLLLATCDARTVGLILLLKGGVEMVNSFKFQFFKTLNEVLMGDLAETNEEVMDRYSTIYVPWVELARFSSRTRKDTKWGTEEAVKYRRKENFGMLAKEYLKQPVSFLVGGWVLAAV